MMRRFSLAVVGADHPNKGKSPARRFELALCKPGESVELIPEPKNSADEHAIAVLSARGVQIGYVTAERAPWIKKLLGEHEVCAVFQGAASFGGWIRVAFDGDEPVLPAPATVAEAVSSTADDSGFWPDDMPPED